MIVNKYIEGGGGSGSTVNWNQQLSAGTQIAQITINGTSQNVYAPEGGGGSGDAVYDCPVYMYLGLVSGYTIDEERFKTCVPSILEQISGNSKHIYYAKVFAPFDGENFSPYGYMPINIYGGELGDVIYISVDGKYPSAIYIEEIFSFTYNKYEGQHYFLYNDNVPIIPYEAGTGIEISDNVINCTVSGAGAYEAGDNITISGNVISATDTTYVAGTNVTISGNVISATDTTYTAGSGISIENNVINCTVSGGGSEEYIINFTQDSVTSAWTIDYDINQIKELCKLCYVSGVTNVKAIILNNFGGNFTYKIICNMNTVQYLESLEYEVYSGILSFSALCYEVSYIKIGAFIMLNSGMETPSVTVSIDEIQ